MMLSMPARAKWSLAACLCCLLGFATLAALTYGSGSFGSLDARILHRLYGYRHTDWESLAHLFYELAGPLPQVVFLAGACSIAWRRGLRRRALAAAVLVVGANVTTQLLKLAFSHPRYQPILGFWQINPTSFPSGHSTAAMSTALVYLMVVPAAWRALVVGIGGFLVLAVGGSVVLLHYHYPSDVVGGWLIAAVWFFALAACQQPRPQGGLGFQGHKRAPPAVVDRL
jgi:membrane-associated phospholipid phosphatase